MNWYVVRHPETKGIGVIAETALAIHKGLGWLRVSEPIPDHDKDQVQAAHYADAPGLDAPAETAGTKAAAKTTKGES
jgi:hypothetical protein